MFQGSLELGTIALAWCFYDWRAGVLVFAGLWTVKVAMLAERKARD